MLKKALCSFLAVAILATVLPLSSLTADAAAAPLSNTNYVVQDNYQNGDMIKDSRNQYSTGLFKVTKGSSNNSEKYAGYCGDTDTEFAGNRFGVSGYRAYSLEDAYGTSVAQKIRAIYNSSYPDVSVEVLNANLGLKNRDKLNNKDAITVTQAAIWKYTNNKSFEFRNVEKELDWNRWEYHTTYTATSKSKLYDYLINLNGQAGQTANIVNDVTVSSAILDKNAKTLTVEFTLDKAISDADKATLSVGLNSNNAQKLNTLACVNGVYTVVFNNVTDASSMKLTLTGTQVVSDVFCYQYADDRGFGSSQPVIAKGNESVAVGITKQLNNIDEVTYTVIFKVDGETVKTQTDVKWGTAATAPEIEEEDSKNYSDWDKDFSNVTSDLVVNKTSSIKTFTVEFKLNGTTVKTETVNYGGNATAPEIEKEDSMNYTDWDNDFTNVTSDRVVNMTSSVKTFTVRFFIDNIQVGEDQIVAYGSSAAAPSFEIDPSKTYSGWDVSYTNITKDTDVKQTTDTRRFTVKFFLDGVQLGNDQSVAYGTSAQEPTGFKTPDKEYSSWDNDFSNVTSDRVVNMTSEIKTFTVEFYVDGTLAKTETVNYGGNATAPEIEKEDSMNYSDWDNNFTNVTSDRVVNMTSEIKTFTVEFYVDGTLAKTETVNYGENATAPEIEKEDSKNYSDWDNDFTNVTSNLEVNMTSEIKTFTVEFYVDGTLAKTETVNYGENATAPDTTRAGYTFSGWNKTFNNVTSDIKVYGTNRLNSVPEVTPPSIPDVTPPSTMEEEIIDEVTPLSPVPEAVEETETEVIENDSIPLSIPPTSDYGYVYVFAGLIAIAVISGSVKKVVLRKADK